MRRAFPLLALALLLPGCQVYEPPGPTEVAGTTDGYAPTAVFLKVFVREDDGSVTWVDFDRKDWHVAEIARRLDRRDVTYLAIAGQERETMGEVLVVDVRDPGELAELKYDTMKATTQERALLDLEYEEILKAAQGAAGAPEGEVSPPAGTTVPKLPPP